MNSNSIEYYSNTNGGMTNNLILFNGLYTRNGISGTRRNGQYPILRLNSYPIGIVDTNANTETLIITLLQGL